MEFESAAKAAERLGVTVRAVQKWAKDGRLPGAKQLGRSWMIPADAQIPASGTAIREIQSIRRHTPLPLLSTSFVPGHALETAMAMEDEDERAIALTEYYYFTGQVETAVHTAEPYLEHSDPNLAMSAELLYIFANLSMGQSELVRAGITRIRGRVTAALATDEDSTLHANAILFGAMASIVLHTTGSDAESLKAVLPLLPPGLQLLGCYILSCVAYLRKEYDYSRAIAELALAFGRDTYPLATNYLRMILCMDLMCLRKTAEARECFNKLWSMAFPDGVIEPIGAHHLLLQGLPEICLKRQQPEQYKRLTVSSNRYSVAWQKLHQQSDERSAVNSLSLIEYAIAALYNRDWAVKEIALHMEMSERMIKHHISMIYEKLGISSREELRRKARF